MSRVPGYAYQTAKLLIKNAELNNLLKTGFLGRWKHFGKITPHGTIDPDNWSIVDGFFMAKPGTDITRYKGLIGIWNRLGVNIKITRDKWNGTIQKAWEQWLAYWTSIQGRGASSEGFETFLKNK